MLTQASAARHVLMCRGVGVVDGGLKQAVGVVGVLGGRERIASAHKLDRVDLVQVDERLKTVGPGTRGLTSEPVVRNR